MSYFDDYKKRMQSVGAGNGEAFKNSTIDIVNKTFADSPFYKRIKINGVDIGTRIMEGRDSKEKTLILQPQTTIPLGAIAEINTAKWLVFDTRGNEVFPKLLVNRCNEVIKWKDQVGSVFEYPCVAAASRYIKYDIAYNRFDVELLQGGMFIYVIRDNNTKEIRPSQRFLFGNMAYEISGVDDLSFTVDGVGLLQFTTRLTTVKENDDFVTDIADNSDLYLTNGGTSGGGGLW